jgi:hypothetical protein
MDDMRSQETKQRFVFLGIPIEGSLYDFIAQLECNGFSIEEQGTEAAIMEGSFYGYQCKVHIHAFDENGIVCKIVVFIDDNSSNEATFRDLSMNITRHYGSPFHPEWQHLVDGELYCRNIEWIFDHGKISVHFDNDYKTIVDFESKMV